MEARANYELTPTQVIEELIATVEVEREWPQNSNEFQKIRVRKLCGKLAHEFVANYRHSEAWGALKSKPQTEMSPVEMICYAMMTDDINAVRHDLFNHHLTIFQFHNTDRYLALSLNCMWHALNYLHSKTDDDLKLLNAALTSRAQIVVPRPVYLNLARADFSNVKMFNQGMPNSNLEYANFKNANLNLYGQIGGSFDESKLTYASFQDAILEDTSAYQADFSHANFSCASTRNSSFSHCDFTGADFSYSELKSTSLNASDFTSANLTYMRSAHHVHGLTLSDAILIGTDFGGIVSHSVVTKPFYLIENDDCLHVVNLDLALQRIAKQIKDIECYNSKYPHLNGFLLTRDALLSAFVDNCIETIRAIDLPSVEKHALYDLLLESELFRAPKTLTAVTNYALKLFDLPLTPETPMQQKLMAAKSQLVINTQERSVFS